jgi:hypothetical protein
MHAGEKLRFKKMHNRDVPNQEPLMVAFVEYLSDDGEEGFPWPR